MYPWERDITREILNSTENPWINKEAIEDVCQGKFIKIILVTAVFKNMEPIKTRLPITHVCVCHQEQTVSVCSHQPGFKYFPIIVARIVLITFT